MLSRAIFVALSSLALLVNAQTEQQAVHTILGTTTGLIFDGHFTAAPAAGAAYTHLEVDSTDSAADQLKHRGLLRFNGAATSYLDLTATSGANSYNGLTLPRFGGAGTGTGVSQGVSFEMVVKFNSDRQWSKIFDFNTGPGVDEVVITLDGDNDGLPRLLVEQYLNRSLGVSNNYDKGQTEMFRPSMNQWYHIALVMKPTANSLVAGAEYGAGNWWFYVNGQKLALSDQIVAGAAFTSIQAANYPLDIVRPFQYLAKSAWSADPNLNGTIDAFRVYSYALSDTVINQLANHYGLLDATNPIKTPLDNPAMPLSPNAQKHRTASISFDPVYTLDFDINPASYVGGSLGWEWMEFDTRDSAVDQTNHRGLARFTGAGNSYVDVMAASGPQSAGKVMPTIYGASSGTGEANGWSIEMVVKPMSLQTWSKYFCMGNGPALDNTYIGWIGGDNRWEAGNYNNLRDDLKGNVNPARATFFQAPTLRKWQHIALVMQPTDQAAHPKSSYSGVWTLYVNGQLVTRANATTGTNYPLPVVRRQSYLALSNWPADAPANMTVDVFRVWDRALNADQVVSLATAYGITAIDGGDYQWEVAMNATGNPWPVYSLDFQQNPTQNGGAALTGWAWAEQDPTDATLVAGSHTGLAIMSGAETSFMNLTAIDGPNRAYEGIVLPASIGGPTTPPAGLLPGWTFEIIFKVTGWNPHAKMFTVSDGRDIDEIHLGFDNAGDNLLFQNLMNQTGTDYEDSEVEISHPTVLNKWYHIVIAMHPVNTNVNSGNWQIYVNGQLQNWATRLVQDMTFTDIQGASFPRARRRSHSYLGKSTWADANARVVYDAFRIYNYIVTPQMVRSFANAYGSLETVPVPSPANNQPIPSSDEATNYIQAGIATAPAYNGVFASNPASFVGGRTDYQWLEFDSADNDANRQLHRGLIRLNGTQGSYVDMARATGPKSVGLVAPVLGATPQMTLETVFKLVSRNEGDWAKLIQFANGPNKDATYVGWNGRGQIEVANRNSVRRGLPVIGVATFLETPALAQWYHVAIVMERLNTVRYDANWKIYVNGVMVMEHTSTAERDGATYPMPLYRQYAYLGKSAWEDANANMLVDMFRVHESALTLQQIQNSAQRYGLFGDAPVIPPTNVSLPQADTDESRAVLAIVETAPVFNAFFGTNPTSAVQVSALEWEWMETHSADDATQRGFHKGIARVGYQPTGQPAKFIDVTTNIGPNSCGQVLPRVGGASSKTGAEAGWSFETVFKLTQRVGWAKIFDFGNGRQRDNIVLGIDGSDTETMAFEIWNDGQQSTFNKGSVEVMAVALNTWYHVAITVEPVNAAVGSANWYIYVNGELIAYSDKIIPGTSFTSLQGAAYPQADPRAQSYLGKSSWGDNSTEVFVDAMRVYDYRLTAAKVRALANLYGCTARYVIATPADNKAVNNGGDSEINMWNRADIRAPVFNANFAVDPRPLVNNGQTGYTWMSVDSNDTSVNQGRHRGLIRLDGTPNSFVNLMTASGPNSIGLVIPTLFGPSSGSGESRGWTVELVAKLTGHVNNRAKLINFGNGGETYFDSWAISFLDQSLAVENTGNLNYNVIPSDKEVKQIFMRQHEQFKWMHITVVMQPAEPLTGFTATWTTYVNGFVVAVTNTSQATMPAAVIRDNSFIGASQYGAEDRFQPMIVDALRVYDFAFSAAQAGAMARVYGSDVVIPSSGSSKLSSGAIAGAVIGAIAGAIILGIILFCFCCAGGSRTMKKSVGETHDHDMGNTGYGEVEVSQQSHVNDQQEDIEMA